jgi:uncharacterized membrane protein
MATYQEQTTMRQDGDRLPLLAWIREAPDMAVQALLSLVGLAVAAYLTSVHYAGVPLACTKGGIVDCAAVTTSTYSVIPGTQVPITLPGMLWFVVNAGFVLAAWRARGWVPPRLVVAHAAWGALGLLTVLYLVFVEIVRLHKICEWCTVIHVLTLISFLLAFYRLQQIPDTVGEYADRQ